jgi:hypothetical protein
MPNFSQSPYSENHVTRTSGNLVHTVADLISFIRQLDLDFAYALAKTSSWNEVLALRPAIRRHMMRETAINVHVPVGYMTNF